MKHNKPTVSDFSSKKNASQISIGSGTCVVAVVVHRQKKQKNNSQSDSEDVCACAKQQTCLLVCLVKGIETVSLRRARLLLHIQREIL